MASKRVPLANLANAANSPFRAAPAATGKRTRAQLEDQHDLAEGQPPTKKHVITIENDENTAPRSQVRQNTQKLDEESKIFMRKTSNGPPTAFERKLAAARDRKQVAQRSVEKTQRIATDNLETIRQWQRHYKRVFPQFVFYFESLPDEIRQKASRQIQVLGAKEEKFFSKAVTHVITTRLIPAESNPDDASSGSLRAENGSANGGKPKTINPSLLDKVSEQPSQPLQRNLPASLEGMLQRRAQTTAQSNVQGLEPRKAQVSSNDVLVKARELGMKIWALEKFQRMMTTMFNTDTGEQPGHSHNTRSITTGAQGRPGKEADLQQLLRNERINGPADRDMAVATQDMCQFRGYYVYIHDMDEKTRPVMARDYNKPPTKEEGKWPQFRLTPAGRCPFVEDPAHTRRLQLQEEQAATQVHARQPRTRTRAAAAVEAQQTLAPSRGSALTEVTGNLRRSPRKVSQDVKPAMAKPLDPPSVIPPKKQQPSDSMPPMFGSAQVKLRGLPRLVGGEPVASGVQPSNVTSAIRSQAISSNISSTAPNGRMGSSREMNALKRKVLERGASGASANSMPSSFMNDMRAALNNERAPPPRAAKRKAQETLGYIHEDPEGDEDVLVMQKVPVMKKKKKVLEKELKPGYCENCHDKFNDFDEVLAL
ncbi:Cdc7p-Dbf4p kinase complex regulatory subunit [Elasticomyces elasticus]|nr:Cdc7p-Dbf4p kinase complex regulatory subunit [Elasticomyces elasticus]